MLPVMNSTNTCLKSVTRGLRNVDRYCLYSEATIYIILTKQHVQCILYNPELMTSEYCTSLYNLENNRWFSAVLLCMYWRIIHGLYYIFIVVYGPIEYHLLLSFLYYFVSKII